MYSHQLPRALLVPKSTPGAALGRRERYVGACLVKAELAARFLWSIGLPASCADSEVGQLRAEDLGLLRGEFVLGQDALVFEFGQLF